MGKRDVGQVLHVLVEVVDKFGELLRAGAEFVAFAKKLRGLWEVVFLLEHPHLDILLEEVGVLRSVLGDDFCYGRAPVDVSPILAALEEA